jgi:hypothetical protein
VKFELGELLKFHPAPWRVEYHDMEPHWTRPCISAVKDSMGNPLWECETHGSYDDKVWLTNEATEALVAFVNASAQA